LNNDTDNGFYSWGRFHLKRRILCFKNLGIAKEKIDLVIDGRM
jgi:hypothetical protein